MGIAHTAQTKVYVLGRQLKGDWEERPDTEGYGTSGDAYTRGVSGGERQRVSIIEVISTRSSIICWDNSTRGKSIPSVFSACKR
jgi:ABC-type multidrug transport system ATPase subunit